MNKKLLFVVASLAITGSALAASGKSGTSPFSDGLDVQFQGFQSEQLINIGYVDNNGVNISGPAFVNPDGDAVVQISSDNKVASGYPSMTLHYMTLSGGTQDCTLNFVDGPWTVLNYKDGSAPICSGITVGNIKFIPGVRHGYKLVITNNEPK